MRIKGALFGLATVVLGISAVAVMFFMWPLSVVMIVGACITDYYGRKYLAMEGIKLEKTMPWH